MKETEEQHKTFLFKRIVPETVSGIFTDDQPFGMLNVSAKFRHIFYFVFSQGVFTCGNFFIWLPLVE